MSDRDKDKKDAVQVGDIIGELTPQGMAEAFNGPQPQNPDAEWNHVLPDARNFLKRIGFDDANERLFNSLAEYFAKKKVGATSKGILALGHPGTGKTHLMQCLAKNSRGKVYAAHELIDLKNGNADDRRHFRVITSETMSSRVFYIDDLGREDKLYGFEAMSSLIDVRWNAFILHGDRTHITTNYNLEEIEERYGDHIRSRIEGMCLSVIFDGDDRRKEIA